MLQVKAYWLTQPFSFIWSMIAERCRRQYRQLAVGDAKLRLQIDEVAMRSLFFASLFIQISWSWAVPFFSFPFFISFSRASSDLAEEAFSCSLLRVRAADTRATAVLFLSCGSLRVTKPDSQLSEEQTLSPSLSPSFSLFLKKK